MRQSPPAGGIIAARASAGGGADPSTGRTPSRSDALVRDIIHSIAPDNVSSQQVARKLGSQNRGPGRLPPPFADAPVDLWGQTREEWRARAAGLSASLLRVIDSPAGLWSACLL